MELDLVKLERELFVKRRLSIHESSTWTMSKTLERVLVKFIEAI